MEEAAAGAPEAGHRAWAGFRRRWLHRNLGKADVMRALRPRVGDTVGGFHLEAKLGEGGYGVVYRARRGGRLYAVKFLYLPRVEAWAWRELEVMLRLRRVGTLRLEGHGRWPDHSPLFLFIAMELVEGRPLYDWARRHNPTARQVAQVLRELARQLVAVHGAGVVHRDVKGANVLVCEADGEPVLVDYGVGTYAGALEVTGPVVPGTALYRSPEALRSRRARQKGERHEASARDDLWALGVVLYWLLTGVYPFDVKVTWNEDADRQALEEAILHEAPLPPHERNPRVPRALSEVCLRLLEKAPEARYPDAQAVGAALEAALAEADVAWEVPLCEAYGPDTLTTPLEAELKGEEEAARWHRLDEYERRHPRRGEPSTREASPSPGPVPASPPARWPGGGAVAGAVVALGLLAVLLATRSGPVSGQEVASPSGPLEGGASAAPSGASTPAPVASTTLPQDMRVKTPRKASPPPHGTRRAHGSGSTAAERAGAALLLCTLASGCPGPTAPQVRPLPPPAECPPGAVQAMKELGFTFGKRRGALFPNEDFGTQRFIPVREGPGTTMELDQTGTKLPDGTVVSGELFFGQDRIHGRFTQAHTPQGETYPVCLVLTDRNSNIGLGADNVKPGKEPGTALVVDSEGVMAVERFE
jgi:serine/threonine-protein kinase